MSCAQRRGIGDVEQVEFARCWEIVRRTGPQLFIVDIILVIPRNNTVLTSTAAEGRYRTTALLNNYSHCDSN